MTDRIGREWFTRQVEGESRQCTNINGQWYLRAGWGFPNEKQAREYYPDMACLLEYYDSGLVRVFVPVE